MVEPLLTAFHKTGPDSERDLLKLIEAASNHITVFGLTRSFYVSHKVVDLLKRKADEIPIRLFLMDPGSAPRQDRYRIEPTEAAMESPNRFRREVLLLMRKLLDKTDAIKGETSKGFDVYLYNFPCSFAIEEIDDVCRVMLYGLARRGTEGPILVFRSGNVFFDYFHGQLQWLLEMATVGPSEPWRSKGIRIRSLRDYSSRRLRLHGLWERNRREIMVGIIVTVVGGLILALLRAI